MSFEIKGLSKIMDALGVPVTQPSVPPATASADPDSTIPVGGRVIDGRFEIVREIGRGGMGLVFQANQRSVNRPVALKVLNPDYSRDADARARFKAEAAAVCKLKNQHTVTVYDFGEDESGELFLVMEMLDGRSLSTVLREDGPLPAPTVVEIAGQVLDSLAEAHSAGILHRDLKPDNVYLIGGGIEKPFVKVLDFGLAKMMDSSSIRRTFPGVVFGTPAYMSPEQVLGHELDARSDLYSVAVVMFEMLTGRLPIVGKTALELGVRKTRLSPMKLEDANNSIQYPPGAHIFFERTLALNTVLRPVSTEEFRQLMTKSFDRKPGAARGGRRAINDIYHAAPTLPEHSVPYNREVQELVHRTGRGQAVPRKTKPMPGTAPATPPVVHAAEPVFVDDALKREPAPRRVAAVIGSGPRIPGDRRKSRRGSHLTGVKCFYDGEEYQATATDISASGAFVSASWLPVNGHRVTILFKFPGGRDYAVSILAEVTRISLGSEGPAGVRGFGVSWLKLRAVGEIETVYTFLSETLGIQKRPDLPASANNNQWEFIFEAGGLD